MSLPFPESERSLLGGLSRSFSGSRMRSRDLHRTFARCWVNRLIVMFNQFELRSRFPHRRDFRAFAHRFTGPPTPLQLQLSHRLVSDLASWTRTPPVLMPAGVEGPPRSRAY